MAFDLEQYMEETTALWNMAAQDADRISLWETGAVPGHDVSFGQREPSLIPFLARKPRGAVIICAGGSYRWKEPAEAFPHARWLNEAGYHAFILDYRVKPYDVDCSLADLQRAIRLLRSQSGRLGIDKDRIVVMGFSSGGHLAARACAAFDTGDVRADDPVERESSRPDRHILCYPHITYDPYTRDDPAFLTGFFGEGYTQADLDRLNVDLHVRPDTPPALLWGMQGDWQHGQRQWQRYIDAMDGRGIPISYHVFPAGGHAEAIEATHPIWAQWTGLCVAWLNSITAPAQT